MCFRRSLSGYSDISINFAKKVHCQPGFTGIATNESLRLLNSRKEEGVVSAEDVQEELMSKLKASDYIDYENELAVKFQEAILSLPEKQRLVFNLRYYDELEYEEIARVLDSKVDTLKVNYHYAKEKIKEYILNR